MVVSGVVNVLALTGSFYMLQVYDRVLTSRSVPSLVALSLLAVILFLFQGGLEVIRGQVLVRLAGRLDRKLTPLAHGAVMRLRAVAGAQGNATQPLRDVDAIRGYLSGQGPIAVLDMPWMPLYVAFAFILHPVLGWMTVGGRAGADRGDAADGEADARAGRGGPAGVEAALEHRGGLRPQCRGAGGDGLLRTASRGGWRRSTPSTSWPTSA